MFGEVQKNTHYFIKEAMVPISKKWNYTNRKTFRVLRLANELDKITYKKNMTFHSSWLTTAH